MILSIPQCKFTDTQFKRECQQVSPNRLKSKSTVWRSAPHDSETTNKQKHQPLHKTSEIHFSAAVAKHQGSSSHLDEFTARYSKPCTKMCLPAQSCMSAANLWTFSTTSGQTFNWVLLSFDSGSTTKKVPLPIQAPSVSPNRASDKAPQAAQQSHHRAKLQTDTKYKRVRTTSVPGTIFTAIWYTHQHGVINVLLLVFSEPDRWVKAAFSVRSG